MFSRAGFSLRPVMRRTMAVHHSMPRSVDSGKSRFAGWAAGGLAAFTMGSAALSSCAVEDTSPTALSATENRAFPVIDVQKLSTDTVQVKLGLPSENHVLGMTTASCLSITADIDGAEVSKPYTPTSTRLQKGHVEFVVKAYPPRTDGQPGGMGRHITNLKVGDSLKLKGPWKKIDVTPNKFKRVGLVAGGTGITPMLQVIQEVLGNADDRTQLTLIYGNQTPDDILVKDRLDRLAADHPDQFKVVYTVDRPSQSWMGETGFVTAAMAKKHLPSPTDDGTMIMVCGPPPMMKGFCGPKGPKFTQGDIGGVLQELGYSSEQCYKF